MDVSRTLDAVAVGSALVALPWIAWRARRPLVRRASAQSSAWWDAALHPWTLFLATSALALANQVAVNAYVLAAHGGDPGFITRYVGAHYFQLDPDFPGVRALAAALGSAGAERWLSPSVLRVNAVLELPFAVFAYLAIARLFDRGVARFLTRSLLGTAAALSFSVVLALVEVLLWNPWTVQDLWLRGVGFVLLAPVLWLLGRRERGRPCFPEPDGRPERLPALLLALATAAAMAGALLVLYDVTLLYNLVHLQTLGRSLVGLILFASAGAAVLPRLVARPGKSQAAAAACAVASALAVLFFVPSLAIRYGLHRTVGPALGLAILVLASGWGLARASREPGIRTGSWLAGLACGLLAGAVGVALAAPTLAAIAFTEAALVGYVVAFVGPLLVAWRGLELVLSRRG